MWAPAFEHIWRSWRCFRLPPLLQQNSIYRFDLSYWDLQYFRSQVVAAQGVSAIRPRSMLGSGRSGYVAIVPGTAYCRHLSDQQEQQPDVHELLSLCFRGYRLASADLIWDLHSLAILGHMAHPNFSFSFADKYP